MVRLKVALKNAKMIAVELFQFHYGSVKRSAPKALIKWLRQFQFHYGSVKSQEKLNELTQKTIFQFHYGSVKRIMGKTLAK